MKINELNKNGVIQAKYSSIEALSFRVFGRKNVTAVLWHILNFSPKDWGHGKTVTLVTSKRK